MGLPPCTCVDVVAGRGVVAHVSSASVYFVGDDRVPSGRCSRRCGGSGLRGPWRRNRHADLLVTLWLFHLPAQESPAGCRFHAAGRRYPSSTACAGRVQGVFHAGPLVCFISRFGRGSDADDRDAAGQLGEAFLELLAIVFASRCLSICGTDLADRFWISSSLPARR